MGGGTARNGCASNAPWRGDDRQWRFFFEQTDKPNEVKVALKKKSRVQRITRGPFGICFILWIGQIAPQVVEQAEARAVRSRSIKPFATEQPEHLISGLRGGRSPVSGSPTSSREVGYVGPDRGIGGDAVSACLADRIGTFDPGPLIQGDRGRISRIGSSIEGEFP